MVDAQINRTIEEQRLHIGFGPHIGGTAGFDVMPEVMPVQGNWERHRNKTGGKSCRSCVRGFGPPERMQWNTADESGAHGLVFWALRCTNISRWHPIDDEKSITESSKQQNTSESSDTLVLPNQGARDDLPTLPPYGFGFSRGYDSVGTECLSQLRAGFSDPERCANPFLNHSIFNVPCIATACGTVSANL